MARQNQDDADHRLADCIRMSREAAVRYAAQAEQEAAAGNHARAAELREWASKSRQEADEQEGVAASRVRRPGVKTAADKARWEEEHMRSRKTA